MSSLRERRLGAIDAINIALHRIVGLGAEDRPSGFDWSELVEHMGTARDVLRSAEAKNEFDR